MKKLLSVVLLATLSMGAFAQVRLPEVPNRAKYVDYSVRDAGFWCAAPYSRWRVQKRWSAATSWACWVPR